MHSKWSGHYCIGIMQVLVLAMVLGVVPLNPMLQFGYIDCKDSCRGHRSGGEETELCLLGTGVLVTAAVVQDITRRVPEALD